MFEFELARTGVRDPASEPFAEAADDRPAFGRLRTEDGVSSETQLDGPDAAAIHVRAR